MSIAQVEKRGQRTAGGGIPRELFGYEIIGVLGQGAGSTIYAASHPQTRQICALKHVVVTHEKEQRFVDQLRAEYEVGRKVAHPGLRRSLDFKAKASWLGKVSEAALVMELVDGVPLDQRIPDGLLALVDCFVQTAHALGALNEMGYCHCDLKPGNILVGADGATKVIDLGQACPHGTKKRRIQGTPDFIAPEQVRCEAVTPRTDVFNLGATMYWCLSGEKLPTLFTAGKGQNSFVVDSYIRSPRDIRPDVPENLSNLVMECVRIKAEKRPADMAEVARRLEVIQFALGRAAGRMAMAS
ncbi:MAG TPA: serine/threonine-protein kinase [Tepidisphaeraceae bacterium]|jgi:serine/threonine-protein kinase